MALGRTNRPGLMVYGGTIRPGSCAGQPQLDIVSAFQSYGKYVSEGKTEEAEAFRKDTVRNSCPGAGACGGTLRLLLLSFCSHFKLTGAFLQACTRREYS